MLTVLSDNANEKSTYVVVAAFRDEEGVAVVPNAASLTWTLTDARGNVVNSRSSVAITSAATINIVLSGLDLAVSSPDDLLRVVTVQGTYNSSLGNNLPLKDQVGFYIENLLVVT